MSAPKTGLFLLQKRPISTAKEAYFVEKEVHFNGKRGLMTGQSFAEEAYFYGKRGLFH